MEAEGLRFLRRRPRGFMQIEWGLWGRDQGVQKADLQKLAYEKLKGCNYLFWHFADRKQGALGLRFRVYGALGSLLKTLRPDP